MGPKSGSGPGWGYLRLDQFLDHLTVIIISAIQNKLCSFRHEAFGVCELFGGHLAQVDNIFPFVQFFDLIVPD